MADIDWGDNKATAATPAPIPSTGSIDWGDASGSPAKLAIDAAAKIPPEQAAKVLRLKDQTGLSTDFVSRNADALQTQQDNAAITPQFSQTAPVTTAHMAEDPHQAALVAPDAPAWNWLERQFNYMSQQSAKGFLDIEHGARSLGQLFGDDSPENEARIKQIEMEREFGLNQPPPGHISKVFGGLVESAPQMIGAMGMGGIAAAAGAATLGASAATAAGWGAMEAGKAYREFSQRTDAQGQPKMDSTTARGAALLSGAMQGALFILLEGSLKEVLPAGVKMLMPEGISSLIESPTLMQGMGKVIARMGETAVTMGGYSGLSTLIHSASGHLGEMVGDGTIHTASPAEIVSRAFPQEDLKAAAQSGVEGAEGGLALGGLTGGMESIGDYRNYANAMKTKEAWNTIGKVIEPTKMSQIAPEQVEKLVSKITPDQHVFIPLEAWQTHFGEQARGAYQELMGDPKGYDEALRTGVDLQIPSGKYAAHVAPSEHGEFFNGVLRSGPLAMNAEEAEKSVKLRGEMEKEEAKAKIQNEMTGKPPEKLATIATQEQQGMAPLFPQPTAVGMSADQAARYRQAIGEAKVKAQTKVALSIMDAHNRQRSASWNNERDSVQKDVEKDSWQHKEFLAKEILGRPIETKQRSEQLRQEAITSYTAQKDRYDAWQEILRSGIKPPEGLKEEWKSIPKKYQDKGGRGYDEVAQEAQERGLMGPNDDIFKTLRELKRPQKPLEAEEYIPQVLHELQPLKLNPNMVKADFPGFDMKALKGMISEEVGVHPDQAAAVLGFNSGAELLHEIKTTPKRDEWVQEETDQRMLARHPEVGSGFNIVDKAMEAVHNEKLSHVLRLELEHLASDDFAAFKGLTRRIMRDIPSDSTLRMQAKNEIGSKTTAETLPSLYQRGVSTSGREADEYFLRGDFEKAFEAKAQQRRNVELFRAATNAKEQTTKDMAYQNKFDSDSVMARIGKAGGTYLEQIQAIRDRFDFTKTTLKELDQRESLRDWYEKQRAAGEQPDIPQSLLNEAYRKSWREMTNDELHSTIDAMRTIDEQSGLKKKLLDAQKGRNYDDTMSLVNGVMDKNFDLTPEKLNKPIDLHPDLKEWVKGELNTYGGWRTRMEPLFRFLGGNEHNNALYKETFGRLNEPQNMETKMLRETTENLNKIFEGRYTDKERAQFGQQEYIPELQGSRIKPNLNKMEMMISLAHSGCGDGMQEMMRGYRMTEPQLRAIWKHLDARDIETVKQMWDLGGSHWEEIKAQGRQANGLPPEKVENHPLDVTIKDGSTVHVDGGYYHLNYDQDIQARKRGDPEDELFGNSTWQTMTKPSYEKARVGGGGQAPTLDFSAFTNNLFDQAHNLAYRDAVTSLFKILNNPDFKERVEATAGKGVYKQFNPWLKNIAGDRPWDPMSDAVNVAANHMTTATLGLKLSSSLVHITSVGPAGNEVGWGNLAGGFKDFYSDIPGSMKFITDKDEFMRSRYENFDRDFRAAGARLNLVNLKPGQLAELRALSPDVRNFAFSLMKYMDMGVAGPTWLGAYKKAMDGGQKNIEAGNERDAIDYASQMVRDTKGSGSAKDLAPVQSMHAGGLGRLMTMFYTQLSVIDNQLLGGYRQFKVDKNFGSAAAIAATSWFGPAIASELIRGRTPKQDENWMWWGAKAIAKFPLNMMFGVKEGVNFFERAGMNFARGRFEISPLEEMMETILRTAGNAAIKNPVVDYLRDQNTEWTDKDYADAAMTGGYLTGLPTQQIVQSAERLRGWMSGAEEHDNPIAGIARVAIGSKGSNE